ncbi:MAG: metal-dependent hydrolase, partial [Aliifodinibius sp.]|nr:metal-dependent hydrolase [Fodinibius sp.]NIV16340.1 metal-dependent hydrolase [Fodinibius sp.]NIY30314.1 metal-dependent hydrolase [Fodinibius sp.]
SNLPDIDVIMGLVLYGNGDIFHRGPTHSLLFGLIMALIASRVGNWWSKISGVSFLWCFLVIFSHVLADAILTH